MTHLSRATLLDWRDRPTEALRAEVVPHLAVCADCAAALAELVRDRPVEDAPGVLDPQEFAARGRAVPPSASRARWRSPWTLLPLAAAAGIVLAVVVLRPGPVADQPVLRGGNSLEALSPSGLVDRLDVFMWDAPAGTAAFRVEILDSAGAVIFEARAKERRLTLPAEVAARLQVGAEYRWSVSRLDARGDTIDTSELKTFTLKKPPSCPVP